MDDSNAIMLPGKKNSNKKMNKVCAALRFPLFVHSNIDEFNFSFLSSKVSGNQKKKKVAEPSKSQKRKLKKLQVLGVLTPASFYNLFHITEFG